VPFSRGGHLDRRSPISRRNDHSAVIPANAGIQSRAAEVGSNNEAPAVLKRRGLSMDCQMRKNYASATFSRVAFARRAFRRAALFGWISRRAAARSSSDWALT